MTQDFESRSIESAVSAPSIRTYRPPVGRRERGRWKARYQAVRHWLQSRGRMRILRDIVLAGGGLLLIYGAFLWLTMPDISDPRSLIASQSSVIVDRNGTELYRLYREEDRTFVPRELVPDHMRQAIVAIEDERFYNRGCLDVQALARVFYRFGQAGGASTLTRQLARNALDLKGENIINRKLKELILGCQLESTYTKDDLLNLYLNWIPFGHNAYGVELASRLYFNQSAKDLTLAQSAVLAALPQAPSYYSPYGKNVRTSVSDTIVSQIVAGNITDASRIPDEDIRIGLIGNHIGSGSTTIYIGGRTDQVLRNMQNQEFITDEQRLAALEELKTIEFKPYRESIRAPHFVLWVKSQVEDLLAAGAEEGMLSQGGLTIETTLDWDMQQAAEEIVAAKRANAADVYEAHNVALISLETGTNHILAYIGNADYDDEEHNGKVDMARAPRQPGSSFKPFVYAAAFEKGFSPATVLFDVPTKIGEDTPQNFDGGFWGLMNIRRALAASRNIPAIKAFFLAGGEESVLEFASRIGAPSPTTQLNALQQTNADFEYGWPLALGAAETPLLEMAQAYATFANGGTYKPAVSILRIKDRRGNILYEADDAPGSEAVDPRIAYEITSVLSDIPARPNEFWQSVLSVPGFQSAAKTGTSNKCFARDDRGTCTDRKPDNLWTMGYTPEIVTGVWMGNADATALSVKAESLNIVSPIWKEYMTRAHRLLESPTTSFTMPSGMVQPQISLLSGQLPTECTPISHRKSDIFLAQNAPSEADPSCVRLLVDRVTGLLASDECPAEAAEERSFFAPQEVMASRFPQWQAAVLTWAESQGGTYDPVTGSFTGSTLPLPLAPTVTCSLSLTPGRLDPPSLSIDFPRDGGSATYPSFQPRLDIDVGSSVREVRFELDGKSVGTVQGDATDFVIHVPRSVSERGKHTLEVTLVDEYFNTVTDSVSFEFAEDQNDPFVRFLDPSGPLTVESGEEIILEADARDGEGGIKYVQFYLDNRLLSTKPKEPYRLVWPQDLNPGEYTLRAVATDLADNEGEDSVELTVE